jgi:hypothetical protein
MQCLHDGVPAWCRLQQGRGRPLYTVDMAWHDGVPVRYRLQQGGGGASIVHV